MSLKREAHCLYLIGCVLGFSSGCSHSAPAAAKNPAASAPNPAPANSSSRSGDVAVEFLADPDAPRPKLDESQEFTPASPRLTPLPEYPPAALAGGGPSALVAVRLWIGQDGVTKEVKDSPKARAYAGPFSAEFHEAVEAAVLRWSFTSARVDTLGPPRPDMPQRPLMSTRYVPTYLDFAFRFTVVEGRGVVSVGADAPVVTPTTMPERVK